MTEPTPTRHFYPTPSWLVFGLLVVEGLLWLSERFCWLPWHKGYAVLIAVASVGVAMLVMLGWLPHASRSDKGELGCHGSRSLGIFILRTKSAPAGRHASTSK
jgi:hypothetical protein